MAMVNNPWLINNGYLMMVNNDGNLTMINNPWLMNGLTSKSLDDG